MARRAQDLWQQVRGHSIAISDNYISHMIGPQCGARNDIHSNKRPCCSFSCLTVWLEVETQTAMKYFFYIIDID